MINDIKFAIKLNTSYGHLTILLSRHVDFNLQLENFVREFKNEKHDYAIQRKH